MKAPLIEITNDDGETFVHIDSGLGSDYTLCGQDTAGDSFTSKEIKIVVNKTVSCVHCLATFDYCKKLKFKRV